MQAKYDNIRNQRETSEISEASKPPYQDIREPLTATHAYTTSSHPQHQAYLTLKHYKTIYYTQYYQSIYPYIKINSHML